MRSNKSLIEDAIERTRLDGVAVDQSYDYEMVFKEFELDMLYEDKVQAAASYIHYVAVTNIGIYNITVQEKRHLGYTEFRLFYRRH